MALSSFIAQSFGCLFDLPVHQEGKAASDLPLDVEHGHTHLIEQLHAFFLKVLDLFLLILIEIDLILSFMRLEVERRESIHGVESGFLVIKHVVI